MPIARKHGWQVLIVRRPLRFAPQSWDDVPEDAEVLCTPFPDLNRALAVNWCRGFNNAELERPYGVWAIVKRCEPVDPTRAEPPTNGNGNGHGKGHGKTV